MSLFLCLFSIWLDRYCWKSIAKSGGFGKNTKRREWPYRGELSIEGWGGGGGFKHYAHKDIERLKGGTLEP